MGALVKGHRRSRPVWSALLALALLGTATFTATAAPPEPGDGLLARTDHVTIKRSGDWTTYDYVARLKGSRELTYRGKSDGDGGCRFSGQEVSDPGQSDGGVIHEREVATNLKDCVMRTERGTAAQESSAPSPKRLRIAR